MTGNNGFIVGLVNRITEKNKAMKGINDKHGANGNSKYLKNYSYHHCTGCPGRVPRQDSMLISYCKISQKGYFALERAHFSLHKLQYNSVQDDIVSFVRQ